MGIHAGDNRGFSPTMDSEKCGKRLSSFLQSEPSLPSNSGRSSNESAFFNRDGMQSPAQSFHSDSSVYNNSPARFSPLSAYAAMSPWSCNGSPSPWSMSPVVTPLLNGKSYGCVASIVRQDGYVFALAASGDLLYTGSESRNIRVWKNPNIHEYGCFKSGSGSVKALLVVRDRVFSAHHDHKIRVWQRSPRDPSAHRRLATLPTLKDLIRSSMNPQNYVQVRRHHKSLWIRHVDAISSLACNEHHGLLYSGSWDKTVKVWRLSDLKCIESIKAHEDAVNAVAVGQDGILYTGSADGTVKVWTRRKADQHVLTDTLHLFQQSAVNALAVSTDDEILYSGSADGIVNFWQKQKPCGEMQHKGFLRCHRLAILCLATAKNLIFSGSADKTIQVWRRDELGTLHSCLAVLQGHTGPVKCVVATVNAFDSCVVYSGSLDRSVKVWSVNNYCSENADDESGYSAIKPVLSPAWVQQKLGS